METARILPFGFSDHKTAKGYILDFKDASGDRDHQLSEFLGGNKSYSEHINKCNLMRDFLTKATNIEVECVSMEVGSTKKDFSAWWDKQLERKAEGDFIFVYFDGNASYNGDDYAWNFTGYPKKPVNAFKMIEKVNKTKIDCLFVLDCFVPTRLHDKWQLKRASGNTEIIARGQKLQNTSGKPSDGNGDFTKSLVFDMLTRLKKVTGGKKYRSESFSIPQIMKTDRELNSNPLRIWFDRTNGGSTEVVKRFKLIPTEMKASGIIEFFTEQIQGEVKNDDDEGVADMQAGTQDEAAVGEGAEEGESELFT